MKCNTCGEEVNFVLIKVTAKWNDSTKDWTPEIDSYEQPMCDTCSSFDIEEEKE